MWVDKAVNGSFKIELLPVFQQSGWRRIWVAESVCVLTKHIIRAGPCVCKSYFHLFSLQSTKILLTFYFYMAL